MILEWLYNILLTILAIVIIVIAFLIREKIADLFAQDKHNQYLESKALTFSAFSLTN